MTNKEIDLKIPSLLGLETRYDVLLNGQLYQENVNLKFANILIDNAVKENGDDRGLFSIISRRRIEYSENIELAISAAQGLAMAHDYTFVLTYNKNETWRAAFGDYKDCEEVEDENPARATCLAIIKFMENR